ncbi:MAG: hypothetical protein MUC83_17790 [Pirellula sp.]|jgi:hypothetical protein|nr:hypothetical protein [Pirellula sp.]
MLDHNPYESPIDTSVSTQAAIDRLVKIRRALTTAIILVLIVGILDAGIGVRRVFQEASETTSVNPAFLASELSQACQFCLFAVLGAGVLYCVRLWAVFRLRFLGVVSGPTLHPSEQYFKQRLNRMLDDDE